MFLLHNESNKLYPILLSVDNSLVLSYFIGVMDNTGLSITNGFNIHADFSNESSSVRGLIMRYNKADVSYIDPLFEKTLGIEEGYALVSPAPFTYYYWVRMLYDELGHGFSVIEKPTSNINALSLMEEE